MGDIMPLYQVKKKIVVTEVYEVEAADRKTATKRVNEGSADRVDSSMEVQETKVANTIKKGK